MRGKLNGVRALEQEKESWRMTEGRSGHPRLDVQFDLGEFAFFAKRS
jgi:hypothetical protein